MEDPTARSVTHGAITTLCLPPMPVTALTPRRALYKATFGDQPSATVANWIITNSTAGVITGNVSGTPNRLLFKGTL